MSDFSAAILADSIGPHGHRLTTFEVTFPRMVLADMTRHRALSYSFESTRAVPTEKRIEQVEQTPYVPNFRRRAKGMGGGEELTDSEQLLARSHWDDARLAAILAAKQLLFTGKEHVGRILEPFSWITGIVSGTEWENFFALRCPPPGEVPDPKWPAQYELQQIAYLMELLYRSHEPDKLEYGDWHLPLVEDVEKRAAAGPELQTHDPLSAPKCSAGRCAAVSYLNQHKGEAPIVSVDRWDSKLAPSAHWSPGEHPAQCVPVPGLEDARYEDTGNYLGWKQLRKFYPSEAIRPRHIQT